MQIQFEARSKAATRIERPSVYKFGDSTKWNEFIIPYKKQNMTVKEMVPIRIDKTYTAEQRDNILAKKKTTTSTYARSNTNNC